MLNSITRLAFIKVSSDSSSCTSSVIFYITNIHLWTPAQATCLNQSPDQSSIPVTALLFTRLSWVAIASLYFVFPVCFSFVEPFRLLCCFHLPTISRFVKTVNLPEPNSLGLSHRGQVYKGSNTM